MKNRRLLKTFLSAVVVLFYLTASSQSFLGAGYGTYNVPGALTRLRGLAPTLKYEHLFTDGRQSAYLDLSVFKRTTVEEGASQIGSSGNIIREPDWQQVTQYGYAQLGLKRLLGDGDEKKIVPYLGGGLAGALLHTRATTLNAPDKQLEATEKQFIWGFHFNAGLQYNFGPVLLELRGNFDLILKAIDPASPNSNVLTNTRLAVLVPLSRH